jgi:hypothetical protein
MINTEQEIDDVMSQWMQTKRFTANPKVNALIRQRVEQYLENGGFVAQAHFERAYLSLLNEDAIQPFRGSISEQPAPAPLIPPDVVAWIESSRVSAFEQRRRYATDPQFKKYYDLYANQQLKAKVSAEEAETNLTVEQYNSMPLIEVVKKYRSSAGFRHGVDKLIAEGRI